MWQSHRRGFRFARLRGRFSHCASVLAIAAVCTAIAPGFDSSKNASDGEGIELFWPGTSAFAKRRRGGDGESSSTYGSFSSSGSSGSSSSSNSGSNSGSSSGSNSSSNTSSGSDNSARNDNNSSRTTSNGSRRRDDDDNNGSGNSTQPGLFDSVKTFIDNSSSKGSNSGDAGNNRTNKSSLGAPDSAAPSSTAKQAPRSPRAPLSSGSSTVDIGNHSHATNEILGVRLPSKAVQALQGMGFTVPPQPKSGFDVLLLNTPPGMSADQAQTMLRDAMPKEKFETNKYYRNYRTLGRASIAHGVTDANARLTCTGSRCVPRELIKWSPETLTACSAGMAVGVLDTGLDVSHPAFTKPITNSFIPEGREAAPNWHGTAVYALLAGNPKSGTPGLIPNATIYHGNVFYSDASGEVATDTHVLLNALDWMQRANVKIVNMSFAGPRDQLMEEAIAKLSAKGMVFVAAVGNEGPTAEPAYPAAYRQVIAVTAIKSDRRIYPYANRGRHIDAAAPGVDIWSAVPGAREGFHTGTSFAAPFITALVATVYRESPTPVKEKLLARLEYDDLGIPGRDSTYGRGLALAPRHCAPVPHVAETPAPPSNWGTTSIDKPSARPASAPTVSAGFH